MKNCVALILFLALSTGALGQMTKSEIPGEWKVQRIIKKSTKPEFRALLDGFGKATFIFHENGDFNLTTISKAPMFEIILKMTKDTKWIFDAQEQLIKIGSEADGYSIMRIQPSKKETAFEFAMDGSEMIFEVKPVIIDDHIGDN